MKTKTKIETNISTNETNSSECPFDFNLCRQALVALKQIINNAQQGHKQLLEESIFSLKGSNNSPN